MATTVHLPPDLLKRVDRRAGALGMSRNLYIRRALENAVERRPSWSPAFLRMLEEAATDSEGRKSVDRMMQSIASRRTRKRPPKL